MYTHAPEKLQTCQKASSQLSIGGEKGLPMSRLNKSSKTLPENTDVDASRKNDSRLTCTTSNPTFIRCAHCEDIRLTFTLQNGDVKTCFVVLPKWMEDIIMKDKPKTKSGTKQYSRNTGLKSFVSSGICYSSAPIQKPKSSKP